MSVQAGPPSPPKDPILGHLRHIRADAMGFYLDAFRRYGDVVRLWFGSKPMYLFVHPDQVKYVLQDHPKNFEKKSPGYTKLRAFFGDGLITTDGEEWRKQRRLAQPAFHREKIRGFVADMTAATAGMLEGWKAHEGTELDIAPEMMRLTQHIVSATLLGTHAPGQAVGDAVAFTLSEAVRRQTAIVDLPLYVPTPRNKRFREQLAVLDATVYGAIRDARAGHGSRADLLTLLIEAKDEETGERMSDKELRDQVLTIFVAGHETTANGLVWTLYFLALHPEIRIAVRQEIRDVLGDRVPAMEDLPGLKLLDRVIKESMRLKPPITRVGRRVAKDDVVGSTPVAAGDYLVVSPYVTHRHPTFWPDPDRFDPDRFLPEVEAQRPRYAYFPFLGGPRQCIGNVFAMVETALILAMIIARYDLELVPGHPVVHEDTFSLRQRYGVRVRLQRATPS